MVVAVLLIGLVLGWAAGGSLERLGSLPLRSRRLVLAGLLVQLLGSVVGGPFYPAGLIGSLLLMTAFLVRNRGLRGTGLIALGLLGNVIVVGANGAMPVSRDAAGRAGVSIQDLLTGADLRHELVDDRTRAPWLADVVPVRLPLRPEVVSPGDVLIAAGIGQLLVLGMLAPRAARPTDRRGRLRHPLPPPSKRVQP